MKLQEFTGIGLFTSSTFDKDWESAHGLLPRFYNALKIKVGGLPSLGCRFELPQHRFDPWLPITELLPTNSHGNQRPPFTSIPPFRATSPQVSVQQYRIGKGFSLSELCWLSALRLLTSSRRLCACLT
jgi:hypothetical protein